MSIIKHLEELMIRTSSPRFPEDVGLFAESSDDVAFVRSHIVTKELRVVIGSRYSHPVNVDPSPARDRAVKSMGLFLFQDLLVELSELENVIYSGNRLQALDLLAKIQSNLTKGGA